MKRSIYVKFGLGALAAVVVFGVRPCAGQINEAYPVIKPEKAAARRDPVAVAFAVPYGTVLNEKQQSEYERLKADKASDLREAIVAANAATDPAEKADLHKEVVKLQAEIRAAMQQILAMPYNEAVRARQSQAVQQKYSSSGQTSYYSGNDVAAPAVPVAPVYNGYYYGPIYGYPWYGVLPAGDAWRGPRDHRLATPLATQKALALAKANAAAKGGATPAARNAAAPAQAKPSPAPAPTPAPPAKPQNQPAKRR